MKKVIGLLLVFCLVFLATACGRPISEYTEEFENSSTVNLLGLSELASVLESENIDVENSEAYDVCVLIGAKEPESNDLIALSASNASVNGEEADRVLKEHRKTVKNYYTAFNATVVSELGLDQYDYTFSYYAPYIEIVFDDLDDYAVCEDELIKSINSNLHLVISVSNCATFDTLRSEANVDASASTSHYPLIDAFDDIGVSDSQYTGNGVKVGVIDIGVPDNTVNLKPEKYTQVDDTLLDDHSTVITSIIGGYSGIAENVHFYCMTYSANILADCNLLIDNYGVNIINMSLWRAATGYYTNYDACVDEIVSNAKCTFVKSAGNRGDLDDFVTAPGCALNAIAVGSVNYHHNISYFSSWATEDSFIYKPDVVAPGEFLWNIPNLSNEEEGHSGTSYAAPMVVGTIALLMEEFPVLKSDPALVKSVLHMGAEKLPSQTDYLDEQAGFGLINYPNMRNILLNSSHYECYISSSDATGDVVFSNTVAIPYLQKIIIHVNSTINSTVAMLNTEQVTPAYTDITIKIFDFTTSTYVASSNIDSNFDYLIFKNQNAENSTYRIDVVLESDNITGLPEFGSIVYGLHSHSYTHSYEWQSLTGHDCYCSCGEHIHGAHVVEQGSFGGGQQQFAICLLCHGSASVGVTGPNAVGELPHTQNGSYILPNGVIVLVEEDMEAYFAGTLVFSTGDVA